MSDFLNSNIFGIIIGFLLSFVAQIIIREEDDKEKTKSFLLSIKSEISNVWDRYYEVSGTTIEKLSNEDIFDYYYPIFDNYFVVYDNNTNLIGSIDENLSTIMVKTYILALKVLKDDLISEIDRNAIIIDSE